MIVEMGKKIRAAREELNLSQDNFCYLTGDVIKRRHLVSIEAGHVGLSLDKFVAVCRALQLRPDYLLGMVEG
jgi:transcriptional regulator with XRE-family HTH domain